MKLTEHSGPERIVAFRAVTVDGQDVPLHGVAAGGQRRHSDLQQTTVLRIHPRITAVGGTAGPVEDVDLAEPGFQLAIEPDPDLFGAS